MQIRAYVLLKRALTIITFIKPKCDNYNMYKIQIPSTMENNIAKRIPLEPNVFSSVKT